MGRCRLQWRVMVACFLTPVFALSACQTKHAVSGQSTGEDPLLVESRRFFADPKRKIPPILVYTPDKELNLAEADKKWLGAKVVGLISLGVAITIGGAVALKYYMKRGAIAPPKSGSKSKSEHSSSASSSAINQQGNGRGPHELKKDVEAPFKIDFSIGDGDETTRTHLPMKVYHPTKDDAYQFVGKGTKLKSYSQLSEIRDTIPLGQSGWVVLEKSKRTPNTDPARSSHLSREVVAETDRYLLMKVNHIGVKEKVRLSKYYMNLLGDLTRVKTHFFLYMTALDDFKRSGGHEVATKILNESKEKFEEVRSSFLEKYGDFIADHGLELDLDSAGNIVDLNQYVEGLRTQLYY